jgi:hypothetical protein
MGQDAEEILHSTNIMEEERGKHDDVRKSFNAFFNVQKNVTFKRARFNRRN